MKKKYNVIVSLITFILIVGSIVVIILFNLPNENRKEFDYMKNYEVNEYMPVYISEEKMAKIYYNDFVFYLRSDLDGALELINPAYREKRGISKERLNEYASSIIDATLVSYSVRDIEDKKAFFINLSSGQKLVFLTSGVMKYEIYLDDYSVEIE